MKGIIYFDNTIFPVNIGVALTEKAYLREAKRIGFDNPSPFLKTSHSAATMHSFEGKEGLTCLVCFHKPTLKRASDVQIAGLAFHEAVHVWQETKERIGEEVSGKEAEAYFIQFIGQRLFSQALSLRKSK